MLEVCCALVFHENRLLAVQRGVHSDHEGQWEFPGGKIESGESAVACIRREIAEELAIEIRVDGFLMPVSHDYGFKQIKLYPFVCSIQSGAIQLSEHEQMCWLQSPELESLDWQQADREIIRVNRGDLLLRLRENDENG